MRRFFPLALASIGVVFASFLVMQTRAPHAEIVPLVEPANNPYALGISATGIVEAAGENCFVASSVSGLIEEVFVIVGQEVMRGEPLFRIDSREALAKLQVDKARLIVAEAKENQLNCQLKRLKSISDPRAISVNEIETKENDCRIARCEVLQLIAEVKQTQALLDKLTVHAPHQGIILQKNKKPGEYLLQGDTGVILGDLSSLQVRIDVDEQNACLVECGAFALAYPKNDPEKEIPLHFVRIEPFLVPKRSLTGLNDERVDTRVLQVIYRFDSPKDFAVYIGQQLDVFIQRGCQDEA